MRTTPTADRLRAFIDLVVDSLDAPAPGDVLARRAYVSRFHFDRLFKAATGEAPARFRRRLLLERAAWSLSTTDEEATYAAFAAGYGSLEAFTRAFERAFGEPPSRYRRVEGADFRLPAPNGVHFHPPGGLFVPSDRQGGTPMDLAARLVEHDRWLTARMLERASSLSDDQLDAALSTGHAPQPYESDEPTVRSMLDRLVKTKEIWTAAYRGKPFPADDDTSVAGLRRRFDDAGGDFVAMVEDVRARDAWDDAFVDALCDPPESFSFGGMVAHVLTFSAYRRQQVLIALEQHGIDDLGSGDPVEWERAREGG